MLLTASFLGFGRAEADGWFTLKGGADVKSPALIEADRIRPTRRSPSSPFANPKAPDSLRVVSLNIAGLSKPAWGHIKRSQIDPTHMPPPSPSTLAAAELRADQTALAFEDHLTVQASQADDRNEVVVFALTEALKTSQETAESQAGNCVYLGSPHASVDLAGDLLHPLGYASRYQGYRCSLEEEEGGGFRGHQGNELLANAVATPGAYVQKDKLPGQCHRLGAQMNRYRFGPGANDWMWVVNTHLSLNPHKARESIEQILATLQAKLASEFPGDWETSPILVVGDFNVVYQGYDPRFPLGWEQDICKGETAMTVTQSDHVTASAAIEKMFRDRGFVHMADPRLGTSPAKLSDSEKRKIDYAFLRNEPEGGWSYGHRLDPVASASSGHEGQVWTDHMGIEVVIRHVPADQVWLAMQ